MLECSWSMGCIWKSLDLVISCGGRVGRGVFERINEQDN
jgi:hypothetical protein